MAAQLTIEMIKASRIVMNDEKFSMFALMHTTKLTGELKANSEFIDEVKRLSDDFKNDVVSASALMVFLKGRVEESVIIHEHLKKLDV